MRYVLVADESVGARALKLLAASPHTVVAVMSTERPGAAGLGHAAELARSSGYPVWPARLVGDPAIGERLRGEEVDVLLNVYSTRRVCPEALAAARVGAFNVHPGLLPQVAGRNPISAALYRGDARHGVTLHHMTADYDAGAIAYQAAFPIEERDTAGSLSVKCGRAAAELLRRLLEDSARGAGAIPRVPQDPSLRTYFGPEMPQSGRLDWARPAREVVDFVRAYDFTPMSSSWGHPRTRARERELEVVSAARTRRPCSARPGTVGAPTAAGIEVATADEWAEIRLVRCNSVKEPPRRWLETGMLLDA